MLNRKEVERAGTGEAVEDLFGALSDFFSEDRRSPTVSDLMAHVAAARADLAALRAARPSEDARRVADEIYALLLAAFENGGEGRQSAYDRLVRELAARAQDSEGPSVVRALVRAMTVAQEDDGESWNDSLARARAYLAGKPPASAIHDAAVEAAAKLCHDEAMVEDRLAVTVESAYDRMLHASRGLALVRMSDRIRALKRAPSGG